MNLYQKIAKITGEVGKVEKTGKNTTQNYSFIEQAMVVAVLREKLAENSIVIREGVTDHSIEWKEGYTDDYGKTKGRGMKAILNMQYTVIDGDDPDTFFVDPWIAEADDTSDKAVNKALTAGEKTYLMKLFKISDKDDNDSNSLAATAIAPVRPRVAQSKPWSSKTAQMPPEEATRDINADVKPISSATKLLLAQSVEKQHGISDMDVITAKLTSLASTNFDAPVGSITEDQGLQLLNIINKTAKGAL